MIPYRKLNTLVTEAISIGFIKDVTFTRVDNRVQFIPNETDLAIEDFLMVVTPDMGLMDLFSEIDRIDIAIKRWRRYNEANEPVSVMSDPSIGRD